MSEDAFDERVFKAPDGPVPKKRKLAENEDSSAPFHSHVLADFASAAETFAFPGPKEVDHRLAPINARSSPSSSPLERRDASDSPLDVASTPPLTPNSSPRASCPSSPCESHHSSQHIHHAKLQVLRALTPLTSPSPHLRRRVGYVHYGKEFLPVIDSLPKTPGKCAAIQALLEAFNLLDRMETIVPAMASAKDLMAFHSEEYVEALRKAPGSDRRSLIDSNGSVDLTISSSGRSSSSIKNTNGAQHRRGLDTPSSDTESLEIEEDMEIYGLKDECTPFPGLWQYARLTAGATILAARYLIECDRETIPRSPSISPRNSLGSLRTNSADHIPSNIDESFHHAHQALSPPGKLESSPSKDGRTSNTSNTSNSPPPSQLAPVAIHWMGGRHHAKREEANGLCYVNDAVLGLLQLINHFERVLYIDIDVHHGDGTEEAFKYSKQVLTISCHLHHAGFYPGSGAIDEIGEGKARYFSINVPFREGVCDAQYVQLFNSLINEATTAYKPLAIVLVAGADCLAGDPLGGFNLTLHGVEHCIKTLLTLNLPLLVLGGGGYFLPNATRLAAIVTAACLDITLPEKIPPHSSLYVDTATYHTPTHMQRKNKNTDDYLKLLEATVMDNIQHLKPVE